MCEGGEEQTDRDANATEEEVAVSDVTVKEDDSYSKNNSTLVLFAAF